MREALIIDAVRTPVGRRGGGLAQVHPADLLGNLIRQMLERNGVQPSVVDDVIAGCVTQAGEQAVNIARNAWLAAGLPESVPGVTVDRQCGSSLQALQFAAQGVMAGGYDLVVAGGVESMSRIPMASNFVNGPGTPLSPALAARYDLPAGWFNQAEGAEAIARRWAISREELDEFSCESHLRAAAARAEGRFRAEILPVETVGPDGAALVVSEDEGIRANPSREKMASLKSPFPGLELITAANSSQISDGASAALLASPEAARALGLKPRARFVSFAQVGVDPVTMLTGPVPATWKALERAGLTVGEIDLFEVNEAFAPVVLMWQKETGAPLERTNVNGGAVALGHPLGATGGRLLATLVNELERRQARYGLIAICEGGGMANGAIVERISG